MNRRKKIRPYTWFVLWLLITIGSGLSTPAAPAHELSGYLAAEGRLFFKEPLYPGQKRDNGSLVIRPEYYHEWQSGSSVTCIPFLRLDSADSERTHFDIRELNYLWLTDRWELRIGINTVFWGVTEFYHLVDIINQTDGVEAIDGEDKLGQPMIHLSMPGDWGTVDLFIMPWFRERTFVGRAGRLRINPPVAGDQTVYEHADGQHHLDLALRYSHYIGIMDFGIYHFTGTGREPALLPGLNAQGLPAIIPFYQQIDQTGIDLQLVAGQWLWKLEGIYRSGQGPDFFATTGGFEYTFVGAAGSAMDVGILGEFAYDERGAAATTPFNNDVMAGLRLAVNDVASTEMLAGVIHDLDNSSRIFTLEASRRFGDRWKGVVETYWFSLQPEDILYSLRDDDYISLELAYYF
jgi:hypothetical protein